MCADCLVDLLKHGVVKCPQCRGYISTERNRLACSAVSLIALTALTVEQKADHLRRNARLEENKPDFKRMLTLADAGESSSSVSSVSSDEDFEYGLGTHRL